MRTNITSLQQYEHMEDLNLRAYGHKHNPQDVEPKSGPSRTRPDMTYTPAELLRRYRQGLPLDKIRNMSYHQDINVPDPRTMDMTEIDDMLELAKQDVEVKTKEYNDKVAARKQQRKQALQRQLEAIKRELGSAATQGSDMPSK